MKTPKKVVFNPKMDNFELLQINGFYDVTANISSGDQRLMAMSNGVKSKPIVKIYIL